MSDYGNETDRPRLAEQERRADSSVIDISGLDLTTTQLVVMRVAPTTSMQEAHQLAQSLSGALRNATGRDVPALVVVEGVELDAIDAERLHSMGLARLGRVVTYLDQQSDRLETAAAATAGGIVASEFRDRADAVDQAARAIEDGTYLS